MMKKQYFIIIASMFLIVSAISFLSAADIQADYQIVENKVLAEINFKSVDNLELSIPYDSEAIELNINDYVIEDRYYDKLIKVSSAENLKVKYITGSYIDKSGSKYFFVLKKQFDESSDIILYLPESAVLDDLIKASPNPDAIRSDGRRIILEWKNNSHEQILVAYEFLDRSNFIFYIIILLLITAFIVITEIRKRKFKMELKKAGERIFGSKKSKKKKKEAELTKNLFEDEKRIVKYLMNKKNNESWTKDIIRDLGISKVKLSRKLRSLEQKEIVKRFPYGNENIVRLMKK
jgi:uncharacterized membrane protein